MSWTTSWKICLPWSQATAVSFCLGDKLQRHTVGSEGIYVNTSTQDSALYVEIITILTYFVNEFYNELSSPRTKWAQYVTLKQHCIDFKWRSVMFFLTTLFINQTYKQNCTCVEQFEWYCCNCFICKCFQTAT